MVEPLRASVPLKSDPRQRCVIMNGEKIYVYNLLIKTFYGRGITSFFSIKVRPSASVRYTDCGTD